MRVLCIWISEELDLPRLAAKLRPHLGKFASIEDVLYPIFKEINYLTYDELKALNVKLAKLDQEAPLLRQKQKGDALVANKMYVSAIKVYQQLLKKEGLEQVKTGAYHEHLAQSGMCVQLSFPDGEGSGMLLGGISYRERATKELICYLLAYQKREEASRSMRRS